MYAHIAEDHPDRAEKFVTAVVRKMFDIVRLGLPGAPRDAVSPGLRMVPFRRRCIYFREEKDRVVILRVLHERQDIGGQEFL